MTDLARDRMRPAADSAKQRARRIPLDYYKQWSPLEQMKWLLTGVALLASGGYSLWMLVGWAWGSERAAGQLSPGQVASVHAAWDGKCAACHAPGLNLRQDNRAAAAISAPFAQRTPLPESERDGRCQTCHALAPHHPNQIAGEVWSCAGCHREHRGAIADLTRLADSACTRCHGDLAGHAASPPQFSLSQGSITSFVSDHPPFRSLAERTRRGLRFNHRLHMLLGQAPAGAKAAAKKTLADIEPDDRSRLGQSASAEAPLLTSLVQLQCEYCHQPETADSATPPSTGAYMQPINFDRHCAACHRGELVAELASGGSTAMLQVPHGSQPETIRGLLAGVGSQRRSSQPPGEARLSPASPLQPIPGRTPGANLAQTTEPATEVRLAAAEASLRGEHRCGKCHEFTGAEQQPTQIPAVWLAHARFDHSAHRAMQCYDCHDRERLTTEEPSKPPLDDRRPILPDIDNCRRCHAPAGTSSAAGVRHDCTLCHRYHGSQAPGSAGTIHP